MTTRLSLRLKIGIVASFILFISEGINFSQLAPFFPNEAELRKGMSELDVGIINSSFDFANIIFCAILPFVAKPELNKFFFLWGAAFGAVGNICFGVLSLGPGELMLPIAK